MFVAFCIGVFAAVVLFGGSSASANRPIPGYHYKDVCKNIQGEQTILDVTGISARYKFIKATQRPNDCRPVNRLK